MKRLVLILLVVFIVSCEENFSPKIEIENKYVVSCVFGTSGIYSEMDMTVYITRTYDVEGTNPDANNTDPTVSDANVKVSYSSNETFTLLEDTLAIYDTVKTDSLIWAHFNRYGNPTIMYSNPKIPIRTSPIMLHIEMPDGTILTSETKLPKGVFFEYSYNFPHGVTSQIDQWRHGDYWGIYWEAVENQLYFTQLDLSYTIKIDGQETYKTIQVPMNYARKNNKPVPVYPGHKKVGNFEYKFSALDKTLRDLSIGVDDKSNIRIYGLTLNVVQFGNELSQYYTSINGFLDEYSVRLDEQVYSNIDNGLGIFGAYKSTNVFHEVDVGYIHSFGYLSIYD